MRYIILAGGKGTRLQSVIKDIPKPMAPIGGRPFMEILLERLAPHGAEEFILCVSHKKEAIMDYFGNAFMGIPVAYSIEEMPLGTGGAIAKAFRDNDLDGGIVLNGDTIIDADYTEFADSCAGSRFAMMLARVDDTRRYGRVDTQGGKVIRFMEKRDSPGWGAINAGVYWISRSIVALMPQGAFSFEKDFLEPNIERFAPDAFTAKGYFIDIGLPETYLRACGDLT